MTLKTTTEWLEAQRQLLTDLLQKIAALVNERVAQIDEEIAQVRKLETTPGPTEDLLESLKWQGPSDSGWWWVTRAETPPAIEREVNKWDAGGYQGTRFHYFVARTNGNLLKKQRREQV